MDRQICAAIKSKYHLLFNYDDLPREIEQHPHSASSKGKEARIPNRRAKFKRAARVALVGCGEEGILSCV